MKTLLLTLSLLLLPIRLVSAQEIHVACLGDSIAAGARVGPGESYPARLQELLGGGYLVESFGIGGATLLKRGRPNVWQALERAEAFRPDVVVVTLGTNDTVGGNRHNWEAIGDFDGDYQELVERLAALPTRPRILVCTPTDMVLATPGLSEARRADLEERRPRLEELCRRITSLARRNEERGVELVELNAVLAGRPELLTEGDGVHPNAAGHRAIAEALAPLVARSAPRKPNLVVFLVDDMGWQETSVPFHTERTALNDRYRTPNMERLAASGVKFTQAYAYAVCSPTRVSLLTGQWASRHRVTSWTLRKDQEPDPLREAVRAGNWNVNGFSPEPGIPRTVCAQTLPQLLREVGYRTIHVGKAHFGAHGTPGAEPLNCGFDVNIGGHAAGGPGSYHGEHDYSAAWRGGDRIWDVPGLEKYHGTDTNLTEALTIEALRATKEVIDAQQPFYLYLSHYAIHAPWEKDARFYEKYAEAGLPEFEATYASMVESMDHSLGDVLDFLDREGIAGETAVLFLSDNGQPKQATPNLPLRGHKLTPYEGGIRVPLLARWPGVTPEGVVCERPVHVVDVMPTVLELAGVSLDEESVSLDGESFIPLLRDPSALAGTPPRALFWHYPNTYDQPPYSAMRLGRWKLIYQQADRRLELYDLATDLSEQHDLAPLQAGRVLELAERLSWHLRETDAVMAIDRRTEEAVELPSEWLEREALRTDLRVMSFNLRYGTARDGEDRWERRAENVAETIRVFDPDLLGVQEALSFQARFVDEALPDHELYGPSRDGPGTDGEASAVLWRRDRFDALERGTFWLSPTPERIASRGWDAALPRICTWVRLFDRRTGEAFVLANTHFDHVGEEARRESAKLVASQFAQERLILTGDFNAGESSAPIASLRAAGLTDAFRAFDPDATEVGTFTGFRAIPGAEKIDYVWFRGDAEVLSASIDRTRYDGRWPSDHLPVTATVRWR